MWKFQFAAILSLVWVLSSAAELAKVETCRVSSLGKYLSKMKFRSYACGECLFFIYLTGPLYREHYRFHRCNNGLLICPRWKALSSVCNCSNPSVVFNLPEYWFANGSATALMGLKLEPALPREFVSFTRACCQAADNCCSKTGHPSADRQPPGKYVNSLQC